MHHHVRHNHGQMMDADGDRNQGLHRDCRFSVIQPRDVFWNLGVMLDSELSMRKHMAKVTSTSIYQLRRVRQVHRYVPEAQMR